MVHRESNVVGWFITLMSFLAIAVYFGGNFLTGRDLLVGDKLSVPRRIIHGGGAFIGVLFLTVLIHELLR